MRFFVILLIAVFVTFPLFGQDDGFADFKTGRLENAMQKVSQALEANPKEPRALELKGRILLAQQKYDEAAQTFFYLIENNPQHHIAYYYLGDTAFAERFWPDALNFYTTFLNNKPEDPRDALLKLIYCHIAMNELSFANRLVVNFDTTDPLHPGYYFAHAAILNASGKHTEAEQSLQQAQTLYGLTTYNRYLPDYLWIFKKIKKEQTKSLP